MLGIAIGTITKSGSSEYGYWAVVAEAEVTKKDGGKFTPTVMCNCKEAAPAEGTAVIAQGLVQSKVTERDGKHYANTSLGFCRFTVLDSRSQSNDSRAGAETFEEDDSIPF